MRRDETRSRGEEMLMQVLEECLEEDLSFVPPEREIARSHRFSPEFEEHMKQLMEAEKEEHPDAVRKHFAPRYGQLAACILLFCVCGGLFCYVIRPSMNQGYYEEQAADSAAEDMFEAEEAAPEEEMELGAVPESASGAADQAAPESEKDYCGQTLFLAEQQEVPETLDYVTTLVNCPVLDEENPVLYLTIGNIGESDIQYLNRYDLEVWLEDGWYLIPANTPLKEEWLTLEAGMAVDEEIDLSDYQIDYGAQQYRLITCVGDDLISAEFTFEEAFSETMERLEEESSGE